jgi:hypothetical protein
MQYFKRAWLEPADLLNPDWGTVTYYFETDDALNVLRQCEVFENGNVLVYDGGHLDDEFGGLTDQPLDHEFLPFAIEASEFEDAWQRRAMNRMGVHTVPPRHGSA